MGLVGPRSYEVQVGSTVYRRNRRQVMTTNEDHPRDTQIPEQDSTQHLPQAVATRRQHHNLRDFKPAEYR